MTSPFELVEDELPARIPAQDMMRHAGRRVTMVGYYVTRKPVRTVSKTLMYFYTWVDEAGDFFDTVHFPPAVNRSPFKGSGCYIIRGKVVPDFGFPSLEVDSMEKMPWIKDGRY